MDNTRDYSSAYCHSSLLGPRTLVGPGSHLFIMENSTILVAGVYVGRISGISTGLRAETEQRQNRQSPSSWLHSWERIEIPTADFNVRKSIWKTLTMSSSSQPVEASVRSATYECCTRLWTPEGRGYIYNTRIIDWIDENASFRMGPLNLFEWSASHPRDRKTLSKTTQREVKSGDKSLWKRVNDALVKEITQSSPGGSKTIQREVKSESDKNPWKTVNHALGKVLGSGMRLASLLCSTQYEAALVNPHALVNDEIFFLGGCSIPVIVRKEEPEKNIYVVVGGAWLDMDREWFKVCHNVALGPGATPMRHDFGDRAPIITTLSLE
jgi:hypothetical protein